MQRHFVGARLENIFVFFQNLLVYFYRESKNPKLKERLILFCSVQPVLQARQMSN